MGRRMVLLVVAIVMAVLGAGLVYAYAQGAEERAADQLDSVERVVATDTIEPGERFSELLATGRLDRVKVPRSAVITGSSNELDDFTGLVATTRIYPGEQLLAGKFGVVATPGVPTGMVPVSVALDPAERGAFTQPGSRVTVYQVPVAGSGVAGVPKDVVLEDDVLVVAIGNLVLGPDGLTPLEVPGSEELSPDLVTVALPPAEAEELQLATFDDTLSIRMRVDEVATNDAADQETTG
ncbi:hypothetical protein [Nocardioides sp. 1609]|uniref:Flp pilus assembly protein CpaB n=1 Tax=Nocardioides sp. 1609 TaxID=2508327 RepID=UPI0010702506|nr:hypothetical protein [Nocardioides sp. 1609]